MPYKWRDTQLKAGKLAEEHFWLLIEISSIHSERVILALKDYLVFGYTRKYVTERYGVNNGYFSVSLARLTNISKLVLELIPFYKKTLNNGGEQKV